MLEEQIIIRQAVKDDFLSLSELMNYLGYKTTTEEMQERYENISSHDDYKTFVASIGNKVVGMAGATKNFSYEHNGKYVRVIALVINPAFRQKGIGKELMQVVENWAKEVGASIILLNCGNRDERKQAHEFYTHIGYTVKSSGYIKLL